MGEKSIIVNRDYQRSDKVWPPAARSYLMETILFGYPIPKLSLYQSTDLKSRKTVKEIVDGQQRSQAIYDFFHDRFKLTGKSQWVGKTFSQLEQDEQQRFVDYQLNTDVFVGATPEEIRQVFRRINSYTVPLNPQEKRHATYQGEFKWFIVEMSEGYSELLKTVGVFSERQLSRMADAALITEVVYAFNEGIESASEPRLDQFYERHEVRFPTENDARTRLETAMQTLLGWQDLHETALLTKLYNFYSLCLAVAHSLSPIEKLNSVYRRDSPAVIDEGTALSNLGDLAVALEGESENRRFADFVAACSKTTNRLKQRETRFRYFCKALDNTLNDDPA